MFLRLWRFAETITPTLVEGRGRRAGRNVRIGGSFEVHGICALGLKATQGVENPPGIVRRLKETSREIAQGYLLRRSPPPPRDLGLSGADLYY
jgi:hypothetical protein